MEEATRLRLPDFPEPYWWTSVKLPAFKPLNKDIKVDVAIAGGGMTGITAGYLLVQAGLKVAILESGKILNGTTGHTTAKITQQHALIYDELISHIGQEGAKLYYEANLKAMNFITDMINKNDIKCGLTQEDAIVYTNSDKYINKISKEYEAYQKLGIEGAYIEDLPIPVDLKAAVVMKNQYQFHPLKYLNHLVDDFVNKGGMIFEETTAKDIEKDNSLRIRTKNGHAVDCKHIICSSHYPFFDGYGHYYARMHAERSYIVAIKPRSHFPGGMYINAEDPTRSLRFVENGNGERLVLVAGENHKTGKDSNTHANYEALRDFGEKIFGIEKVLNMWSAQDLTTIDKIPYIGEITNEKKNIYIATGYRKWGMTNSTSAALIIADAILEKENPFAYLFKPTRFIADPSIKNFIIQNTDVGIEFVSGKLSIITKEPKNLRKDEGGVVTVNGRKAGGYRDSEGHLHVVDSTCTHLGCEVKWNSGDRTWDCPCHGSRFSFDGEVVEGPAMKALEKIEVEDKILIEK
ncbi:FAD-dependent oxidoreductase [Alkaliphilus serpentinus]|uniref:FAD-dependent oxidoreductase n=1 Tax=Alkaliphilus serpentinus TaxID=1482731 RepID=A0A833M7T8_9FIRM|nr:FAD-dependent oxidoreductase [Alkaliphilus serpentinus]KAB3529241.1 FAD-dependent oxidoreductase [Alkaliphilus serpentinus]